MEKKTLGLLVLVAAVLLGAIVPASAKDYTLCVDSDELIYGVMCRDNVLKDPNAIGDKHKRHKAYGLLQIRAPYLADVNKIAGKEEIQRLWGKDKLTMEDMKDEAKAEWSFHVYLSHYGDKYTKKTGKKPTAEIYARIHNGGPNGWLTRRTLSYAKAVVRFIMAYRAESEV